MNKTELENLKSVYKRLIEVKKFIDRDNVKIVYSDQEITKYVGSDIAQLLNAIDEIKSFFIEWKLINNDTGDVFIFSTYKKAESFKILHDLDNVVIESQYQEI